MHNYYNLVHREDDALIDELAGVHVTLVEPGAIRTDFLDDTYIRTHLAALRTTIILPEMEPASASARSVRRLVGPFGNEPSELAVLIRCQCSALKMAIHTAVGRLGYNIKSCDQVGLKTLGERATP